MSLKSEPDLPSLTIPNHDKGAANKASSKNDLKSTLSATKWLLVFTALFLFTFMAVFIISRFHPIVSYNAVEQFNQSRNYALNPFNEVDAYELCHIQTQTAHGEQLITSYPDAHSSRFEPGQGIYKIFLVAHIGTYNDYQEAKIHCHINPYQHQIKYYKTIFPRGSSIMSRALKFFNS